MKADNSLRNSANFAPSYSSNTIAQNKQEVAPQSVRNSLRSSLNGSKPHQPSYQSHTKKKKSIRNASLSSGKSSQLQHPRGGSKHSVTSSFTKNEESLKVTTEYLKELQQVTAAKSNSGSSTLASGGNKVYKETVSKNEYMNMHLVGGASQSKYGPITASSNKHGSVQRRNKGQTESISSFNPNRTFDTDLNLTPQKGLKDF